jgi:hypothetical protein
MIFSTSGGTGVGIAKLKSTGKPDLKFGADGYRNVQFSGPKWFTSRGVAVRPEEGQIVIIGVYGEDDAGSVANGYGIMQLTSTGSRDPFFGEKSVGRQGQATFPDPSDASISPSGLLLLSGGRAVSMLSSTPSNGSTVSYSIRAFTEHGDFDNTTFGERGALSVSNARNVFIDNHDRLLVTNSAIADSLESISRFTTAGKPDTSFGTNGKATITRPANISSTSGSVAAAVQKDRRIVVVSEAILQGNVYSLVVSRLWD